MKAVFRYPGSKWSIADWIIGHFPEGYEKMVYLEPFLGSGAVFFNKRTGAVETVNDLDGDIVNLFRVLRERPEELKQALSLTPYSRQEYDRSFEPCGDPLDRITRSRARIVLSGYPSALYDETLRGWYRDSTFSQTTSAEMAEEVIWMNYEPPCRQIMIGEMEYEPPCWNADEQNGSVGDAAGLL